MSSPQGAKSVPSLTLNDLASRLLAYIDDRRDPTKGAVGHRSGGKRFNLKMLARSSGLTYRSVRAYIIEREVRMSLDVCDALMYGLGINVLDLIQPHDLASVYDKLDPNTRYIVRRQAGVTPTTGKYPSTRSTK